jgi:AraC-like DNA-binding protein
MESFSTAGMPVRRKVHFWNEINSDTFAEMDVVPGDRDAFQGYLRRDVVGPVSLADVCSTGGTINHTRAHVSRSAVQRYVLMLSISGGFRIALDDRPDFALRVGESCLLDHTRPFQLSFQEVARTFCVVLPHPFLCDIVPELQRVSGVPIRATNPMSRMLILLLQNLNREMEQDRTHALTPAYARSLAGFIAGACSEVIDVAEPSVLEARKRCIRQYIDEALHDPELNPSAIAEHFGISARYLRLIFESGSEPVSAYIQRRRLERCARLLRDPSWDRQTITDIAFRSGFNNATYFGYAFKKRFGVTPRDYRRTMAVERQMADELTRIDS